MIHTTRRLARSLVAFSLPLALVSVAHADPATNRALVSKAMSELFVKRDATAVERYWGKDYVQHNPTIANGRDELPGIVKSLPAGFKYEPGMIAAQGDIVMIHGRYTGWAANPLVVVDIFRVKGGRLVEHWDVVQEEVPADKTKSGNPMFKPGE
jgi:predicted SnoaL-like aldol condensation-catalyzing enzyme